jgi:hypothetical protein
MGQIRNRNGGQFQPQSRVNLSRRALVLGADLVHDLVAPEIIYHCIPRLDRMKCAIRCGRFEQSA